MKTILKKYRFIILWTVLVFLIISSFTSTALSLVTPLLLLCIVLVVFTRYKKTHLLVLLVLIICLSLYVFLGLYVSTDIFFFDLTLFVYNAIGLIFMLVMICICFEGVDRINGRKN